MNRANKHFRTAFSDWRRGSAKVVSNRSCQAVVCRNATDSFDFAMQIYYCCIAITMNMGDYKMHGQLTIRLNDKLEQGLEALSQRFHQKRSEIVRHALERFIAEEVLTEDPSPWQKVQHLAGVVETGVDDLGESHREHLRARFKRNG